MASYIDMHCDTLMKAALSGKRSVYDLKKTMVDVKRLYEAGCKAQFFAVFLLPIGLKKYMGPLFPKDDRYIRKLHQIFKNTMQQYPDVIAPALNAQELEQNFHNGKVSGILTMEDGRGVDGSMEKLEEYYNMGFRVLGLTWNQPNCFGSPNSRDASVMAQGLTDFGKDAVIRMNELGMGIDVSHLSDGGFWDVVSLTNKPFLATHSNCRSLNPHPRSMTDEMIRALADKGGVMGVNFGPQFLTEDTESKSNSADAVARQLRHMIQVGGLGVAAIGSDFDGISSNLELSSPGKMAVLFSALEKNGFTATEIEHIAHANVERVLAEVL